MEMTEAGRMPHLWSTVRDPRAYVLAQSPSEAAEAFLRAPIAEAVQVRPAVELDGDEVCLWNVLAQAEPETAGTEIWVHAASSWAAAQAALDYLDRPVGVVLVVVAP